MNMTSEPVDRGRMEAVLRASGQVRDAAVVERPAGSEPTSDPRSPPVSVGTRLIAYVVADDSLRVSDLRACLTEKLPDQPAPSAFVLVETLPSPTDAGRDWSGWPVPSHNRPDLDSPYAQPRNVVETILGELWARALGLDEVGIHDDFMELGGDSHMAMWLTVAIEERFGQDIALASIFDQPTIARFAATAFGSVHSCDPGGRIG
jgi:acyl carrier protein